MRLPTLLTATHPGHLVIGLTIWAIWFVVVYGGVSLACAIAPPTPAAGPWNWINAGVGVLTLATIAGLSAVALFCWRGRRAASPARHFVATTAAGLYLIAAVATLAVGAPALRLPPCV